MARKPQKFTAQVKDWANLTERKMLAIVQQSAQEVFSLAQTPQPSVKETGGTFEIGKIPVDWGDLRRSFVSGLNGSTVGRGTDSYILAIAQSTLGDTILGGWTAEYARAIESGDEGRGGRFYMRTNAAKWQSIVRAVALRAKNMR